MQHIIQEIKHRLGYKDSVVISRDEVQLLEDALNEFKVIKPVNYDPREESLFANTPVCSEVK